MFYDVIHRFTNSQKDVGFQFRDEIIEGKLVSKLEEIDKMTLKDKFGHHEIVFS